MSSFFLLLKFPSTFLPLPMRSTVIPQMKIGIKSGRNDTPEFVNLKAHIFGKHWEPKVVGAQELHMKIRCTTTQTRLQSQGNWILREVKQEVPESDQEEERSISSGERMVYRGPKLLANLLLELQPNVELQTIHQIRGGSHGAAVTRDPRESDRRRWGGGWWWSSFSLNYQVFTLCLSICLRFKLRRD